MYRAITRVFVGAGAACGACSEFFRGHCQKCSSIATEGVAARALSGDKRVWINKPIKIQQQVVVRHRLSGKALFEKTVIGACFGAIWPVSVPCMMFLSLHNLDVGDCERDTCGVEAGSDPCSVTEINGSPIGIELGFGYKLRVTGRGPRSGGTTVIVGK